MKIYNFNDFVKGDDYAFLLKALIKAGSRLDFKECNFKLKAIAIKDVENSSLRKIGTAVLPLERKLPDSKSCNNLEYQPVLTLSTLNGKIKVKSSNELILIIPHEDTEEAKWDQSLYTLQLITKSGKYKTIMKGYIAFQSENVRVSSYKTMNHSSDSNILDIEVLEIGFEEVEKLSPNLNSQSDPVSRQSTENRESKVDTAATQDSLQG